METSATTIVVPPTAEEQRIASIADSINLADPSLTVTYGTEAMQGISRFADDLLSRVQAKDSGELGESLTNLMLKVKDVNVSEVMGSPGFLQSLPLVGSLFSSAKRTVAKFNTLSEQIEIIVDKLDEAMIGLLRDIETLEMLYEHNVRFHAELTAYIEVLPKNRTGVIATQPDEENTHVQAKESCPGFQGPSGPDCSFRR